MSAAIAYNAGLKTVPFSVLPYAMAFALLPVAVTLDCPRTGCRRRGLCSPAR